MKISFSPATTKDIPAIQQLLHRCKLPAEDVAEHLDHFLVASSAGTMIGTVGLEVYGSTGLLRSLAVEEQHRGEGLGTALYEEAVKHARELGIQELSLLTTTAEGYFANRGFLRVERGRIPGYVKQTKEYKLFCPSAAVCMSKHLTAKETEG